MCKHPEIQLDMLIKRRVIAVVTDTGAGGVTESGIVELGTRAYCPDCGFEAVYNAYATLRPAQGATWPKWLRRRMTTLALGSDLVREALAACHVPSEE